MKFSYFSSLTSYNFWSCIFAGVLAKERGGGGGGICLRISQVVKIFAACEISQPADTVHILLPFNSSFSYNPPFHAHAIKFCNLLSHSINGH